MQFISEPTSDGTRYGFGFTDKKPGWEYYAVRIALVIGTIVLVAANI